MDALILHVLRDKRRYTTLLHAVPKEMLAGETQTMLAWYSAYWQAYPEAARIELDALVALVKLRSGNAKPEDIALTLHIVSKLADEPDAAACDGVVNQLTELDLAGRAGALIARYNAGEEVDLSFELQALAMETRRAHQAGGVSTWADRPIHEYLEADSDTGGLQWTAFPQLAANLKGLRPGDNVGIAAPTDKGKTSLLCRLGVSFQEQAKVIYPGRPMLYLVNEGTAERITPRMYQTATGLSRDEMYAASNAGTLLPLYEGIVGPMGSIRIKNIHGKNMSQVEQIIQHHNPHTVITDMTGRIKAVSNRGGGANDINQLEEVWNGMRELAVIHNFGHIGTIQVSAEGFEQIYPPISAMQNSKTGIQTTLDLIIMMGAISTHPNLRGLHTPKNKLARSGKDSLNQFQAVFTPGTNTWNTGAA